jgi:hypothetical protein
MEEGRGIGMLPTLPPDLHAEADVNQTRHRVCTRSSILKFGDGRVAGWYVVPPGGIESRAAALFILSGAFL